MSEKRIRLPNLTEPQDVHSGQLWLSPYDQEVYLLQAVTDIGGEVKYTLLLFSEQSIYPYHSVLTMASVDGNPAAMPLSYFANLFKEMGFIPFIGARLSLTPQRNPRLSKEQRGYLETLKVTLADAGVWLDSNMARVETNMLVGHTESDVALTMIGLNRLQNIWDLADHIFSEFGALGDFAECGVWRGGATIFMRAILKAYNSQRKVFVCDSFKGFKPLTNPTDLDDNRTDTLPNNPLFEVSEEDVCRNFKKFELLDDQVVFVKGFFEDSLKDAPIEQLSLLRVDCDLYDATYAVLEALYPKVSPGGFVIIDDYGNVPSCRAAVRDYLALYHLSPTLHRIDWTGVYWRKE